MFEQFDFDTMGKVSNKAVKDKAREIAFAEVIDALTERFGADFVSVVGGAEIAVSIGSRTVSDGTAPEVPVVVKITAKEFETHSTASGKPVYAYDRFDEAEAYAEEKTAKEAEAEARAKKKAAKIAADKAAREKAKAEKAAKAKGAD